MNDVSEIRNELARIASELRAERQEAGAARLDALNSTFFTTTTEYLVESLNTIDEIVSGQASQPLSVGMVKRIDSVRSAARRLANLR